MAARMVWDYVVRVQFSALRPIPSSSKAERQCEELGVPGALPGEEAIWSSAGAREPDLTVNQVTLCLSRCESYLLYQFGSVAE